jgi:hypothetical protein
LDDKDYRLAFTARCEKMKPARLIWGGAGDRPAQTGAHIRLEQTSRATTNEEIMFDRADQIGLAVLAADGPSQTGVIVAIVVATIGAVATFSVGLLNFLTQRRDQPVGQ